MNDSATSRDHSRLRGWVWVVFAVLTAPVVLLIANMTQGACYDSATDPAASYCTSGPILTVPGVWIIWGLWTLFAASCVYRVIRATRRSG